MLENIKCKFLSLEYTHCIEKKQNLLLMHADSISWAFVPNEYKNFIELLHNKQYFYDDIKHFFETEKIMLQLLEHLWEAGILNIDGKFNRRQTIDKIDGVVGILKVTKACNLKCDYCYIDKEKPNTHMNSDMIELIVKRLCDVNEKNVSVILHGGEPLLNFIEIKKAVRNIKKWNLKKNIFFYIQSNGTIVNEEIINFIKKEKIGFGISLDAPKNLHDSNRKYRNNKGSFDDIMKNIEILKDNKVGVSILTVLNSKNIEHIEEIIDFYISKNLTSFSFIPFQSIGEADSKNYLAITSKQYLEAMTKLFKRIEQYNKTHKKSFIAEREFLHIIKTILFGEEETSFLCKRTPCGAASNVFAFDYNGDVYCCDDFLEDPKFYLGNVKYNTISDFRKHENALKLQNRCVNNIPDCKICPFKKICCGGCASSAYSSNGVVCSKTEHCEYYKNLIDFIFDLIEEDKLDLSLFLKDKSYKPFLKKS